MEGAARVFAGEFNQSTLSVHDEETGTSAWVVTPGGAWCRLMYLAGALTEVSENGDMLHCRLADPTGGFDLVSGGRRTPLSNTFRKITLPSFVTVTGRAQMYRKNKRVILSVRPDHVLPVNRDVRDRWVLSTAESTLARLEQMRDAVANRCTDKCLLTAVRHYQITSALLRDLGTMVEGAVQSVRIPATNAQLQPDVRGLVMEMMRERNGPRGVSVEEIIEYFPIKEVSREGVLAAIEALILDDECYQPQTGFIKLL